MSIKEIEILQRALERQKKARKQAEKILEEKSLELFNISQELKIVNEQLENLLDEKNSQLKGIFENINDAYLVMDIHGNVLKMNDVAVNLFGFDVNEEEVNVVSLIYPEQEDYDYAMNSYAELLKNGYFTNYIARVITKTNEIKWVNINSSVVFDKNNNPIAAQGIIRDITNQRKERQVIEVISNTAKSILGKEDIYEIAWEISKNIANYLNTDDCVIYLVKEKKKQLELIASFDKRERENKKIYDKMRLPFGKGVVGSVANSGISEIINNTNLDDRYVVYLTPKLSELTVPIKNEDKVIGVINIEHQEQNYFTEEHLKTIEGIADLVSLQLRSALNIKKRKKVEKKNIDLLKKVEKSNQELEEYAHIVSHDLKSPIRSIHALTSWIKSDNAGVFDEASLQNFELIENTLEKMEQLITDVLEYSSITNGAKENNDVDLNLLIEEIKKVIYIPKNISIKVLQELPIIKGDKTKFQQLFQNLISNAIKFNDKEKGIIEIDVKDQNSFYKFSIKDNGIGIEKEHFDKIFKIFQSLKKSKDSSGIGLSIVKKIVNFYKGEIWLESEINKGTTFFFTIKK
ncbi:GAF domain-containing sensor histidine kinase [Tenacibaculum singaporense]|uniref:GAF domain-containing sensor histidine kinase n=1 Tax=Tenacibaculum singaporense TaxID=2358479 RepID=UPI000F670744|nr:ATP-binding protein [Tenacibaculum singaporense]RSC93687.1 PAS domain S-box protein [Tenacibaculum singaporense]